MLAGNVEIGGGAQRAGGGSTSGDGAEGGWAQRVGGASERSDALSLAFPITIRAHMRVDPTLHYVSHHLFPSLFAIPVRPLRLLFIYIFLHITIQKK